MDMEPETTSTTVTNETLIAQGISFLRSLRGRTGANRDVLSGRIEALEKSGFKPAEITEVLKRYSEDNSNSFSTSHGNEFVGNGTRQGWFLNSVLPAVLVLGAGAIALYLTGGEDEDTSSALKNENERMTVGNDDNIDARTGRRRRSRNGNFATEGQYNHSDEEDYNSDHALHEPYDDYDGGDYDVDHDHDTGLLGGGGRGQHRPIQTEPDWAKEVCNLSGFIAVIHTLFTASSPQTSLCMILFQLLLSCASMGLILQLMRITATIADDVHNIKHKLLQSNNETTAASADNQTASSSTSSGAAEQSSSDAAVAVPVVVPKVTIVAVRDHLLRLHGTLRYMAAATVECNRNNNGSAESSKPSSALFQQGCGALLLYVSKVHEHPSVPRYRKIAVSNATFKTLVEPLSGYAQVLAAVGFSRLGGTDGTGGPSQVQGKNFEWTWGGSPPETEKDSASTLLQGVNDSSDATGKDRDHIQNSSKLTVSEGTEETVAATLTTTTTADLHTTDAAITGSPSLLSPSSSSLSSQAVANNESTGIAPTSSIATVVTSCTPFSRPATDTERATVLTECLRILQIGKDKGAAAIMTEIEESPS